MAKLNFNVEIWVNDPNSLAPEELKYLITKGSLENNRGLGPPTPELTNVIVTKKRKFLT